MAFRRKYTQTKYCEYCRREKSIGYFPSNKKPKCSLCYKKRTYTPEGEDYKFNELTNLDRYGSFYSQDDLQDDVFFN